MTITRDVVADVASVITVEGTDAAEPDTDGAFTFTRPQGASAEELTMGYEIAGSARPGKNYEPLDGTVTFAAGEATATEVVEIIDRMGRKRSRVPWR